MRKFRPLLRSVTRCQSSGTAGKTDFGFKDVASQEKERLVREVFSKVASKYDVMNDLMSVGAHRLWKDELIQMMGYPTAARIDASKVPRHLDVAGGTGDIAFRSAREMSKAFGASFELQQQQQKAGDSESDRQVVVCDINPEMLAVGASRAPSLLGPSLSKAVGFVEGNAESLPFPDESFDVYTIGFGLRNVTNKQKALEEAYRVLRHGGRILIMEFSHLTHPALQAIYDAYSFNIIPEIGNLVAGDKASYQYLVESIRRFPRQDQLCDMVSRAGFKYSTYTNFNLGIVAVHSGFKL
jgi:2-methoxy-6-polyprenyl-1,4-benzoquinol methylase